jgi:hypothetical protein
MIQILERSMMQLNGARKALRTTVRVIAGIFSDRDNPDRPDDRTYITGPCPFEPHSSAPYTQLNGATFLRRPHASSSPTPQPQTSSHHSCPECVFMNLTWPPARLPSRQCHITVPSDLVLTRVKIEIVNF